MTLDAPPPPTPVAPSTMRRDLISAYFASGMKILSWTLAAGLIYRHDYEHFALFVLIRGTLGLLNYTTLGLAPAVVHLLSKARADDNAPVAALAALPVTEGGVLEYANPELRKTRKHPEFHTRRVIYSAGMLSLLVAGLATGAVMLYTLYFPEIHRATGGGSSMQASTIAMCLGIGLAIRLATDAQGAVLHTFGQITPDNVALGVTELVWMAFMSVLGDSAEGVAVSFLFASFTPLVMRSVMILADVGIWWPKLSYLHFPTAWKLLSFGLLVSVAQLADFMYAPTDYILIDQFLDKVDLATYAPAVQIDAALLLLVSGLAGVLLPKTAIAHAGGNRQLVQRYYRRGTLASLAMLLAAGLTMWIAAPWIFRLWLGDPMPATQAILPLVLIHTVVGGSSAVGRSVLLGMGKVKPFTVAVLIAGVSNVLLSILFAGVLGWGLKGIILGTIIAVVGRCAVWQPWYVWRCLRDRPQMNGDEHR